MFLIRKKEKKKKMQKYQFISLQYLSAYSFYRPYNKIKIKNFHYHRHRHHF